MRRPALLTAVALLAGLLTACGGGSSADVQRPARGLRRATATSRRSPSPRARTRPRSSRPRCSRRATARWSRRATCSSPTTSARPGATARRSTTPTTGATRRRSPSPTARAASSPAGSRALTGTKAGSRVLMVVPPEDGYGKQGNPQAGIKGTDSLVFVVDVIASYNSDTELPERTAVTDLPDGLPTVSGEADPTVTVPEGTEPPKEPVTTVLAEGTGDKVVKGKLAIVQFTAVDWTGKPLSSTWERGPQGFPIGVEGQPSPFDLLEGVPVGSRVLLQLPAPSDEDASTAERRRRHRRPGPARPGQEGGQRMTDKPEIDFPDGPAPTDLADPRPDRGRRRGGGPRQHGGRPLRRRRVLDGRGVRRLLEPRRAVRLPARRGRGHRRLGPRGRRDEGRRPPPAGHPARPGLRRPRRRRGDRARRDPDLRGGPARRPLTAGPTGGATGRR